MNDHQLYNIPQWLRELTLNKKEVNIFIIWKPWPSLGSSKTLKHWAFNTPEICHIYIFIILYYMYVCLYSQCVVAGLKRRIIITFLHVTSGNPDASYYGDLLSPWRSNILPERRRWLSLRLFYVIHITVLVQLETLLLAPNAAKQQNTHQLNCRA